MGRHRVRFGSFAECCSVKWS